MVVYRSVIYVSKQNVKISRNNEVILTIDLMLFINWKMSTLIWCHKCFYKRFSMPDWLDAWITLWLPVLANQNSFS